MWWIIRWICYFVAGVLIGRFVFFPQMLYWSKTKGIKTKTSLKFLYSLSAVAPEKWLVGGIEYADDTDERSGPREKALPDGIIYYSPHGEGVLRRDDEEFSVFGNRRDVNKTMSDCALFKLSFFDYLRIRLEYRAYVWRRRHNRKRKKAAEKSVAEDETLRRAYASMSEDIKRMAADEQQEYLKELGKEMKATNSVLH